VAGHIPLAALKAAGTITKTRVVDNSATLEWLLTQAMEEWEEERTPLPAIWYCHAGHVYYFRPFGPRVESLPTATWADFASAPIQQRIRDAIGVP